MADRAIGGYNPIPMPLKTALRALNLISTRATLRLLAFIFTRPLRFKTPQREEALLKESDVSMLRVLEKSKELQVYRLPNDGQKILFVHGWNGRGSQFYHLALELHKQGLDVTSFDLPGHGKSTSKFTAIPEIVSCVEELSEAHGPFDCVISHSMGTVYALSAVTRLGIPQIITFCHPSMTMRPFFTGYVRMFGLPTEKYADLMMEYYEGRLGYPVSDFSPSKVVAEADLRALILHCQDDKLVDSQASIELHEAIEDSRIVITKGLGHFRILSDEDVTKEVSEFMLS